MRAVRLLEERGESRKTYNIFSDSQAAIARVQHDGCGPGQALAKVTIAMTSTLVDRNNTLTIQWTPSHAGVCGNEQADQAARRAAEEKEERADPTYLTEASLSYLTRKATEQRTQATNDWIRTRVGQQRRYRPPSGGKMRKGLAKIRKELASRNFNSSQDTRQPENILLGLVKQAPHTAGDVELGRDKQDITFLLSAEGGNQRSGGCGREFG